MEEHVQIEASWGVDQRTVATYRAPDRARGRQLSTNPIEALSTGVTAALAELVTLGRTLTRRAADVLAYFERPAPATDRPRRSTDA